MQALPDSSVKELTFTADQIIKLRLIRVAKITSQHASCGLSVVAEVLVMSPIPITSQRRRQRKLAARLTATLMAIMSLP